MNIAAIANANPLSRAPDAPVGAAPAGFELLLGMASALPQTTPAAVNVRAAPTGATLPATPNGVASPMAAPDGLAPGVPPVALAIAADQVAEPIAVAGDMAPAEAGEAAADIPAPSGPKHMVQAHPGVAPALPLAAEAVGEAPEIALASIAEPRAEASPALSIGPEPALAEQPFANADTAPSDAPIPDLPVPTALPEAPHPAPIEPGVALSQSVPPQGDEPTPDDHPPSPTAAITADIRPRAPRTVPDSPKVQEAMQATVDPMAVFETLDGLPSQLLSQALPGGSSPVAVAGQSYGAAHVQSTHDPVVAAQPGQIGREMGVEIARQVAVGRDEVLIRLDPAEMGRIDVRLSFDREGSLRAVMAADSPAALDMLRREAGELTRALADAGVRADAQSFRFDSRGGDAGQAWQRGQHGAEGRGTQNDPGQSLGDAAGDKEPVYRPLRTSGRVDLMA